MPRKRGLCWRCYHSPEVRAAYPVKRAGCNSRGVGNGNATLPPPSPTAVLPGPDKVAVLEQRAAAGLCLWHPRDAKDA